MQAIPAPGESEDCDWCGRSGTVREGEHWTGKELVLRDPALCDVCFFWWSQPGEVLNAMAKYEPDPDAVWDVMEAELARKWRQKVADGRRRSQHPGEVSTIILTAETTRTERH